MSEFFKTARQAPKDADSVSAQLLLRAKYIKKLAAGIYSFLPLGLKVQQNLIKIIDEEMAKINGQKILMPVLQPKELWQETDRWDKMDPPLFRLKDRHEREYGLGSTHEEIITDIVRQEVFSYEQLPLLFYQIQTKFRNEMRATGGLLRAREFLMKDGYSFHADKKDLDDFYQKVIQSYFKIFERCGLKAIMVEAHSGSIGGEESNEFMVLAENGEDKVLVCQCGFAANAEMKIEKCKKCGKEMEEKNAIEIAHIFKLNDLYSQKMNAKFTDQDGQQKFFQMGCYGIGIDRLLATVAEISHDDKGLIWPENIAPYKFYLIQISPPKTDSPLAEKSQIQNIYDQLQKAGIEVLFDDRDVSVGEKFADADLLGIPFRLVVGGKVPDGKVEKKERKNGKIEILSLDQLD